MSDDLRERVARTICQEQCAFYGEPSCWDVSGGPSPHCDEPGCQAFADAAISLILEEAARVADGHAESYAVYDEGYEPNPTFACERVAEAIRAIGRKD